MSSEWDIDLRDHYWIVGADADQAYSSASGSTVPTSSNAYVAWLATGRLPTRIASNNDLVAVLRAHNLPPYHSVSSYRIVRRLEEAGLASQSLAVLDAPQNAVLKARFYTLGNIPADDQDARALISAAGADPNAILAPE